ncbi:hypothetical protein [Actinoplanes siamensis]|uniref:Uncharacterized protein n=1 Tax=Actinoplanes siamensis TaxID=1223317 RepID=A0A919TMU9_9ACTN|nr:hypothetical protein [Actinoplanes siamensis]GIF08751.1 hypothetical protein Asi03nite_62890 [Actinoplanes siamensis]
MGALVTLHPPIGSPHTGVPWVVTIGSLGDREDWDPVVCGPYEREHAIALARAVVADDDLMAVVEPMFPLDSADAIRAEIGAVRAAAENAEQPGEELLAEQGIGGPPPPTPGRSEVRDGWRRIATRLSG